LESLSRSALFVFQFFDFAFLGFCGLVFWGHTSVGLACPPLLQSFPARHGSYASLLAKASKSLALSDRCGSGKDLPIA
jgi:hypothetical protein